MASTTGVAGRSRCGGPDGGVPARHPDRARRAGGRPRREASAARPRRRGGRAPSWAGTRSCPAGCAPDDLPALLQRYYWSEPAAEVLGHDPAELAGLALGHLRLAEVRPPGSATVDVHRAGRRSRGRPAGHRRHAVPGRLGHRRGRPAGHRARARRAPGRRRPPRRHAGGSGLLRQRRRRRRAAPTRSTESWMAVVLDGPLDDEAAADLVAGLRTVLDDVRAVARGRRPAARPRRATSPGGSTSWPARPAPPPDADPADDPAEAAALLRWLADGNFVFLGARDVDLVPSRRARPPHAPCPGTGLGVLRSDTDMSAPRSRMPEAARAPEQPPARRSPRPTPARPVHRPAWLDLVAVEPARRATGRAPPVPLRRAVPDRRPTPAACATCRWCGAASRR